MRILHVIEIDGDRAFGEIASNFHLVPVLTPRHESLIVGKWNAKRIVDDKDLPTVWVRLCSQVHVIEFSGILVIAEHTAVTVVTGIFRVPNLEF